MITHTTFYYSLTPSRTMHEPPSSLARRFDSFPQSPRQDEVALSRHSRSSPKMSTRKSTPDRGFRQVPSLSPTLKITHVPPFFFCYTPLLFPLER